MKKRNKNSQLFYVVIFIGMILLFGIYLYGVTENITGQAVSKSVRWNTYLNGQLKISSSYSQYQFLVTEVALSPQLVNDIKNNKAQADIANLVAGTLTLDVDSAKQFYAQNWEYFDFVKRIKELKKTDIITTALAQATSMIANKVSANCLTKAALQKAPDRDGWVRFKIQTSIDGRKNSRIYPDWVYLYVVHDWGPGICKEEACQGSLNPKTYEESSSCFG